jgi:succinate dehydrogenase/fumarate reductase flavoprotein subunit
MELVPTFTNTQGGPRRNRLAQVLDTKGNPIPRLYSAGEMGSIFSWLYQGSGNLGECIVFGRIAGENAAKEKPWV